MEQIIIGARSTIVDLFNILGSKTLAVSPNKSFAHGCLNGKVIVKVSLDHPTTVRIWQAQLRNSIKLDFDRGFRGISDHLVPTKPFQTLVPDPILTSAGLLSLEREREKFWPSN